MNRNIYNIQGGILMYLYKAISMNNRNRKLSENERIEYLKSGDADKIFKALKEIRCDFPNFERAAYYYGKDVLLAAYKILQENGGYIINIKNNILKKVS
jgi:hypothetical protein